MLAQAILDSIGTVEGVDKREIEIEPRVCAHIATAKYRSLNKIREIYEVDFKFPRRSESLVVVSGVSQEAIDDGIEQLLNLAEEVTPPIYY